MTHTPLSSSRTIAAYITTLQQQAVEKPGKDGKNNEAGLIAGANGYLLLFGGSGRGGFGLLGLMTEKKKERQRATTHAEHRRVRRKRERIDSTHDKKARQRKANSRYITSREHTFAAMMQTSNILDSASVRTSREATYCISSCTVTAERSTQTDRQTRHRTIK